jgi:hypothetical protein
VSSGLIIALELTLVLGGVLALAVWELLRLRRDRSRPPARADADANGSARADRR